MANVTRKLGQLFDAGPAPLAPPVPTTPVVTPTGTAAEGGTPDQAKMAGTPAQKAPALDTAVKSSLTTQQRLTPQAAAPSPDTDAAARADRLRALGSLGSRVQAAIEARLKSAFTAPAVTAPAVNDKALTDRFGDDPAKLAAVRAALAAYAAAAPGAKPAALQALSAATGESADALVGGGLQALFQTTDQMVEAATTKPLAPLTLADVAATPGAALDLPQLAQDLGLPAETDISKWTPDQLQAAVQNLTATQLGTTEALRQELKTATPQRAAQIQAQLRAAGESGVAGLEASVAHLSDQLEAGEQVQFVDAFGAPQSVNVRDLLADDKVSLAIQNAVQDPKQLEALRGVSPALADWVVANKAQLDTLVQDIGVQARQFKDTQDQASTLLGSAPAGLAAALGLPIPGPGVTLTPAQLEEARTKLEASPVFQAAKADGDLRRRLADDPTLAGKLTALSAPQLEAALSTTRKLEDPKYASLLQLLGLGSGPITDPAVVARVSEWLPAYDKTNPLLLSDPEFQQQIADGKLTTPSQLQAATATWDMGQQAKSDTTLAKLLGFAGFSTSADPALATSKYAAYQALTSSADFIANPTLADDLKVLVDDGTITTPGQLTHLAAHPGVLADVIAHRAQVNNPVLTAKYKNVSWDDKGGAKVRQAFKEDMAKVLGVKSVDRIVAPLEQAQKVLANPKEYTKDARAAAQEFLKRMEAFDFDGDGTTTVKDFGFADADNGMSESKLSKIQAGLRKFVASSVSDADVLSGSGYKSPYTAFREWIDSPGVSFAGEAAKMKRKPLAPIDAKVEAATVPDSLKHWYQKPNGAQYRAVSPRDPEDKLVS